MVPDHRRSCVILIVNIDQLIDPAVFPDRLRGNVGAEAVLDVQAAADVRRGDVQGIQRREEQLDPSAVQSVFQSVEVQRPKCLIRFQQTA